MATSWKNFPCRNFSRFLSTTAHHKKYRSFPVRGHLVRSVSTQPIIEKRDVSLQKIVIPNRIERSPTAVLETLAAEASRDPQAPDYCYMDDPFLIPTNNIQKRNYSLAKGSGRKAAHWVIENFPDAFANELIAEPRVHAFMPSASAEKVLNECGNTVTALDRMIENQQVEPAWNLYTQLKAEGTELSNQLQQQLLELLCYFNSENNTKKYIAEDINYQRDLKLQLNENKRTQKKTWKNDGPAMQLFDQTEKTSHSYNAVIQGMCKYGAYEDANKLYNCMVDQKIEVSEATFNSLISGVPSINDDNDTRWGTVSTYLKDMQLMNIPPTLDTFNTILSTILGLGKWRRMKPQTIEVLGEMKECKIEPSLSTWASVVRIFYYTDKQTSPILHQIIDHVENHGPYTLHCANDFDFFSVAMNKTCNNLQDVDLAKRIDAVLNKHDNANFLGDATKESQYYNTYLKILCSLDILENIMEVYDRCTPHVFTPNIGCLIELLNTIELYNGYKYLPQIWSDLVVFDYLRRNDILEPVFSMMAARVHENSVQENCRHVMSQIRDILRDAEEMEMINPPITITGSLLGNWIRISINCKDLDLAMYFYDLYETKPQAVIGIPSEESLTTLASTFIELGNVERFMNLIYRISELGYATDDLIRKGTESLTLTDAQSQRLSMMK